MVNARTKGAAGERKVATELNEIIYIELHKRGLPIPASPIVQRNQNQSAVGGADLINTLGYSIEVKCQEVLNVKAWWKQALDQAEIDGNIPVVIYKQNNVKRICLLWVDISNGCGVFRTMGYINYEDFLEMFKARVQDHLEYGGYNSEPSSWSKLCGSGI